MGDDFARYRCGSRVDTIDAEHAALTHGMQSEILICMCTCTPRAWYGCIGLAVRKEYRALHTDKYGCGWQMHETGIGIGGL
jgi:hypothetical protein